MVYHFWNDVLALFPFAEVVSPVARNGHLAVPAFFMLSGFVLAYNYGGRFGTLSGREYFRFLALRWARVYPVHLVTLLAVFGMVAVSNWLGYELTGAGYTAADFVLNLLLAHTWVPHFSLNWNYPSWSISSEWFAYLLFPPAVGLALRHLSRPPRAWAVVGVSLAAAIAHMLWWRPWPFYELLLVLPTFLGGAALAWAVGGRIGSGPSAAGRWVPAALVSGAAAVAWAGCDEVTTAVVLACSLGLVAVLAWAKNAGTGFWTAGPVVYLGEVSYSLYMTHTLAQKVVYRLLPSARFASADWPVKLGVTAAYAGLVAAVCLVVYYGVERPCRRLVKRAFRRTTGPPAPGGAGAVPG